MCVADLKQDVNCHASAYVCVGMCVYLTFHTDAPEISNLHQYFGEHAGFLRSPPPHIELHTQEGK